MAGMSKTQLVGQIAEKHGINKKTAAAFLEHLADLAQREDHHEAEVRPNRFAENGAAEQVSAEHVNHQGGDDQQAIARWKRDPASLEREERRLS